MTIPLEGACQSNGSPGTYYKYTAEVSNRRPGWVHYKLWVYLRMATRSSFFSFGITHACKVNGVYQTAWIKSDRTFWGGWSTFGWAPYGSNYDDMVDGTKWHGPFLVFDRDVPVGIDDTSIEVIPCITRPCICDGSDWDAYAYNANEICNWEDYWGQWVPWGDRTFYGYYASRDCPEDGAFLNNYWKEPLAGGNKIQPYARPKAVQSVKLSPASIDIAQKGEAHLIGEWQAVNGAAGYDCTLTLERQGADDFVVKIDGIGATSDANRVYDFGVPSKMFGDIAVGDKIFLSVIPYDSNKVYATNLAESGKSLFIAHIAPSPVDGVNVGGAARVDVAVQDTYKMAVSWSAPRDAGNLPNPTPVDGYNVYVSYTHGGDARTVKLTATKSTSITISPKSAIGVDEIFDGDGVCVLVECYDKYGYISGRVSSYPIVFYETPSTAPTSCYVVGRRGESNLLIFKGENASIRYRGMEDGSYPIKTLELVRLSDGSSVAWESSEGNGGYGSNWGDVDRFLKGVQTPNTVEEYELRAYNTKNRPAYASGQTWLHLYVTFYGGIAYVWDGSIRKWLEGVCYVYDGDNAVWHEAEAVYVRSDDSWKTM